VFGRAQQPKLVAEGVVQLGTDLVNWFLVDSGDAVVVVDTGLPGYRRQLEAGLALLGRRPEDVSDVVLTHAHGDHTGAAEALRSELGATVHVHEAEADAARTAAAVGKTGGSQLPYLRHPHAWRLLAHFRESGSPAPVAEVAAFADGAALPGGLRAVRTEGHTPGHCVFLLEDRGVLFAGDHLTTRNPLTGGRGPELLPRPLNVSSEAMLASLDRIERLAAETLLFGHGEPWPNGAAAAVRRARDTGIT
jgi:glyoxylase-like metal-dependent hydrolase (beta-lactamase superfamily II)